MYGAEGGNRTRTVVTPLDFESNILLINTNYVKLLKIAVYLEMTGLQGIL